MTLPTDPNLTPLALGLLVEARRAGVFASLREVLDDLTREGFHVSAQLVTEALRHVGEG